MILITSLLLILLGLLCYEIGHIFFTSIYSQSYVQQVFPQERFQRVIEKTLGFLQFDKAKDIGRVSVFEKAIILLNDPIKLIFGYGPGFIDSATTSQQTLYRDTGYLGIILDVGLLGMSLLFLFVSRYIYCLLKIIFNNKLYFNELYLPLLGIPICFIIDPGNPILYSFGSMQAIIVYLLMGITIYIGYNTSRLRDKRENIKE